MFLIKRAGWTVTKINSHLTFEQSRFKRNFILMNQKSRQKSKTNVEKDFYKLMNNSNFGYDCRNNIANCQFVPIFDEYKEISYINQYHNIFDKRVSSFITPDILKHKAEEDYNDKLMKLDKKDRFYEIKLQTLNAERRSSLESTEIFEKNLKRNKKRKTLHDYGTRKDEVFRNQQIKSLIDFDQDYSSSIRSVAVQKSLKVNLNTRFLNGILFPNEEIQKIYNKHKINKCYLDQNVTDTDSSSMFFVFICDLQRNLKENEVKDLIFEIILKSKLFDRIDLSADYFEKFQCKNPDLKKQVGLFEVENIDKTNITTIALNPKEYYEKFNDYSDNKKHKGLKISTPDMYFDSYSARLADLTEYFDQFCRPVPKKIEQKRFQVINESMQMNSISKVQFGQLNDKRFYFCDGIVSLPYSHPLLQKLRDKKLKYRNIHSVIQKKKEKFLQEESEVIKKIPRLDIIRQIYNKISRLYELNSDTNFISLGLKPTKEYIKNGSWK